ncbi:MAG TPA: hypothetical protein VHZ51_25965 [Ktedonobacteraceae bacterium]|nr:hypothetical protein [Ktedonobacteraceae bacterium]
MLSLLWRPSVVSAILYGIFLILTSVIFHYHALHYVHIGNYFSYSPHSLSKKLNGAGGYDGQFYYFIARNPLTAYHYTDNAPYRYQRIVYPIIAFLLSLGNARLLPYTLLLINFVAIVLGVEIVARLLKRHGLSPWYSLAFGLYFGQATALLFDTTEPLTYLFICLGLLFIEKKRINSAAICLGLAVLSRETAVLFPVGFIILYFFQRRWPDMVRLIILGLLPTMIWYIALTIIFGKTGLTSAPAFELIPFLGLFAFEHNSNRFIPLVILMFIPTIIGWLLAAKEALQRHWAGGIWLIWLMHLGLISCMAVGSYKELASAGRLSTGIVLAMLLCGWQLRNKLVLWGAQIYALTFPIYVVGVLLLHFPS